MREIERLAAENKMSVAEYRAYLKEELNKRNRHRIKTNGRIDLNPKTRKAL